VNRLLTFIDRLRPVDLVTFILIIAWLVLKCNGINHVTDYVIIAIVSWYYGASIHRNNRGTGGPSSTT
jgi:hypothetical protein